MKQEMEWPAAASLDEYEKLVIRMNTPRVVIDNAVCNTATLVKVDSTRKHGILLESVQVLTDLNLSINKAYISSDGRYFMDVFHVTDSHNLKLTDSKVISYIEHSFTSDSDTLPNSQPPTTTTTTLELTGSDRPGLFSEISAVLSDLDCNVVDARIWTHNSRIAALITVPLLNDSEKIFIICNRLRNVLRGDHDFRGAKTSVSSLKGDVHPDRRLHQMMFSDRDYERSSSNDDSSLVSVQNWVEKGYSVVSVHCRDRPKLLFDVVCTLTDMEYVVFHGTIDTNGDRAYQEFYIRHSDGTPISSEAERQRVIQCLQAAIERRASEGLRLELCALDRRGLLADVTRTFRENGLSVTRAEISTKEKMAVNTFYVTDAAGHPADYRAINAVVESIGADRLKVVEDRGRRIGKSQRSDEIGVGLYYIGSIVKRNLYNLGLIRSCS